MVTYLSLSVCNLLQLIHFRQLEKCLILKFSFRLIKLQSNAIFMFLQMKNIFVGCNFLQVHMSIAKTQFLLLSKDVANWNAWVQGKWFLSKLKPFGKFVSNWYNSTTHLYANQVIVRGFYVHHHPDDLEASRTTNNGWMIIFPVREYQRKSKWVLFDIL